ncbi:MAG: mechanosensitive ion channel [Proteobacteria bacterium]|nr:mechanosensitive ion channel [Pseudomonadota bacterium]
MRSIARHSRAAGIAGRLAAILLALLVGIFAGAAQAPAAGPATGAGASVSDAEIKALLATLENEDARNRLIADLRALLAARGMAGTEAEVPSPAEAVGGVIGAVSGRVGALGSALVALADLLADAPRLASSIRASLGDPPTRERWLGILLRLFLVFAAGLLAEAITRRALRPAMEVVENRKAESLLLKVPILLIRTVLELVPAAAFGGAAHAALSVAEAALLARLVVVAAINAYLAVLVVMALARMTMMPRTPGLRLIPLDDETANYVVIWVRRLATVGVAGFFTAEAALLLGLDPALYATIRKLTGFALTAMAVVLVLQNRGEIGRLIRGEAGEPGAVPVLRALRQRLADIWHVLAVLYVVAIYLVWALEVEGGFEYVARATVLTAIILALARLASAGIRRVTARMFAIGGDLKAQYPGLEARANRYLSGLQFFVQALVAFIAALSVLQAWGVESFAWLGTRFGQRLIGSAFNIALVLVIAVIVWESMATAIQRYLNRTDDNGQQVVRSARARTLLPLVRNAFLVVLVALVALIVLSELGVNIGPLLAGAGVVGLAVGFGSQKLVQDVITGAFLLFDDAVSVGDVIQAGNHSGVVEALSIRAIRLRDLAGNVHIIPFSTVDTVVNMTKDYSRYVFEVGIAYREDYDAVVEVLKGIAREMRADPAFGPLILDPGFEVLGLDAFADSAVIIKARITTRPIKQWEVGREFNRRMKRRFDELGIEIPFPHRTIYFGVDKDGGAPPARLRLEREEGTPGTAERPLEGGRGGERA